MSQDMDVAKTPAQDDKQAPDFQPPASKGEKLFNWFTYSGLNYWANLAISITVMDVFMHGKGNSFFKKGENVGTEALTKLPFMSKKGARWVSNMGLGTFTINSGGNILLVPTKLLEDNKRKVVHWLNDKLGVDQTAPDGHKETADEIYIKDEQDKQTWKRMIGRRALAWGATTVTGLAVDKVLAQKYASPIVDEHGDLHTHKPGTAVFTGLTKDGVGWAMKKAGPKTAAIANDTNGLFNRLVGYTSLDWIFTIITSKVMHATNGTKVKKMPNEIGEDSPAPIKLTNPPDLEAVLNPTGVYKEQQEGKHAAAVLRDKEASPSRIKEKDDSYAATIARQQSEAVAPMQL